MGWGQAEGFQEFRLAHTKWLLSLVRAFHFSQQQLCLCQTTLDWLMHSSSWPSCLHVTWKATGDALENSASILAKRFLLVIQPSLAHLCLKSMALQNDLCHLSILKHQYASVPAQHLIWPVPAWQLSQCLSEIKMGIMFEFASAGKRLQVTCLALLRQL